MSINPLGLHESSKEVCSDKKLRFGLVHWTLLLFFWGATPSRVIPWNHDPTWMFSQSHNRNWAGYSSMHLNGSWEWNPIKNCLESSKKLKSEHLYGLILSLWSTKIIQKYFETDFVTMLDGVMEWTKSKTAVLFLRWKTTFQQVETMDSKILWTDLDISTTHWLMQCKIPSSFSTNCSKLSIYIIDSCPNFQENSQFLPCLECQALPLQSEDRAFQLKGAMHHYASVHFQLGRLSPNLQHDAKRTMTHSGIQIQNNQKASSIVFLI